MQKLYVIPASSLPPAEYATAEARAAALGCSLCIGDPTQGLVTEFPSAVVISSALAPVVMPDTSGQATTTAIDTAATAATAAEAAATAAVATAKSTLATLLSEQAAFTEQLSGDITMLGTSWSALTDTQQTTIMSHILGGFSSVMTALVSQVQEALG